MGALQRKRPRAPAVAAAAEVEEQAAKRLAAHGALLPAELQCSAWMLQF